MLENYSNERIDSFEAGKGKKISRECITTITIINNSNNHK